MYSIRSELRLSLLRFFFEPVVSFLELLKVFWALSAMFFVVGSLPIRKTLISSGSKRILKYSIAPQRARETFRGESHGRQLVAVPRATIVSLQQLIGQPRSKAYVEWLSNGYQDELIRQLEKEKV